MFNVDVDLETFSNFNKLRGLTTDMSLVAKALSTSDLIQASLFYILNCYIFLRYLFYLNKSC